MLVAVASGLVHDACPGGLAMTGATTSSATSRSVHSRESRFSLRSRQLILGYFLLAPVVLWRLFTVAYPFFKTIYLSFFDSSPVRRSNEFIGLQNYQAMLKDVNVTGSLQFTIFFTVISVSLQVLLALGIAQLLNRPSRVRNAVRAINLMPWAMPAIVTALAAVFIFDYDYGLITDLVWRVTGVRMAWLSDPFRARLAVVMTDVWKHTAFLAVIFLSGLQGISEELYDAAKIDGADSWRSYRYITLPLLMPLILSMTLFLIIYRVLTFEIVYALTQGGPGSATSLLSYAVYVKAFTGLDFGYASALAVGLFLIVLFVGLIGYALVRRAWARL